MGATGQAVMVRYTNKDGGVTEGETGVHDVTRCFQYSDRKQTMK